MADEVYVGQGYLTLHLDTKIPLTGATSPQVKYAKPGGKVTGTWPAIVSGTEVVYELSDEDIDIPGTWKFQAIVQIGGRTAISKTAFITFKP